MRRPAGKKCGFAHKKIGNAHLRWALGEAVALLVRQSDQAKKWLARRQKKSGKGKALGILAAKLGRALYWMLRERRPSIPNASGRAERLRAAPESAL